MNVWQAFSKMDELDKKIHAIVNIMAKLEFEVRFADELIVLSDMKKELYDERQSLNDRLDKTQLVNLR